MLCLKSVHKEMTGDVFQSINYQLKTPAQDKSNSVDESNFINFDVEGLVTSELMFTNVFMKCIQQKIFSIGRINQLRNQYWGPMASEWGIDFNRSFCVAFTLQFQTDLLLHLLLTLQLGHDTCDGRSENSIRLTTCGEKIDLFFYNGATELLKVIGVLSKSSNSVRFLLAKRGTQMAVTLCDCFPPFARVESTVSCYEDLFSDGYLVPLVFQSHGRAVELYDFVARNF